MLDVMRYTEKLNKHSFTLAEMYEFEEELQRLYPNNKNIRPKIRQQLQRLRDNGYLAFLGNGKYEIIRN
ncbi:hypothetical protein [Hyphococcus luteus]|uniref:hypothetical protein n=1 Tax=Hyphococcus luteus TaxID=2058213 RepID=UPI002434306B|nr:hypothetical protein [Marinicaulis flavus]